MNKQREILENNKYFYVKDMLTLEQCAFIREGMERDIAKGRFRFDDQCGQSPAIMKRAYMESMFPILVEKLNSMLQIELVPTYAYARYYSKNETMARHTDRPACEYSFTATIDYPRTKQPWEIFFGDPDNPIQVSIKRGDAVVYKGEEIHHWRDANPNPWQIQIFYHFVDANGPYKHQIYDCRDYYNFDQEIYEEFVRRGN